jgi:3-oxoacyl-[acyl-carrier protein] reductase
MMSITHFDDAFAAFGQLDFLVNNDGVLAKVRGDLLDVSPESYDPNFAVNTRGAFVLTQAVCKRMLGEHPAEPASTRSIIFIASSNAAIAAPERGEYTSGSTGCDRASSKRP